MKKTERHTTASGAKKSRDGYPSDERWINKLGIYIVCVGVGAMGAGIFTPDQNIAGLITLVGLGVTVLALMIWAAVSLFEKWSSRPGSIIKRIE